MVFRVLEDNDSEEDGGDEGDNDELLYKNLFINF